MKTVRVAYAVAVVVAVASSALVAASTPAARAAPGREDGVARPDPRPPRSRVTGRDVPAKGRFLVASRRVVGPYFYQTVVLLLGYEPGGAAGLIINRPTERSLAELVPEVEELRGNQDRARLGGPVDPRRMMVLIQSATAPPESEPVVEDIYVTLSLTVLRRVAAGEIPGARFIAFAGYAGWGPGQLDREIARGDWHVDTADAEMVFDRDPAELWPELIDRNTGIEARAPDTDTDIDGEERKAQGMSSTRPNA